MEGMEASSPASTRVDKWLWAVRLYKTRSQATEACAAGHVRVNGAPAKAAHSVRVGDRVEARAHDRPRVFEVVQIIEKRVSAPLAAEAFVDHSPPPPPKEWYLDFARDPGAGRPTKKDRRALDRLRKPP
jgi:ribosome-associated heat shock protein Hsp15